MQTTHSVHEPTLTIYNIWKKYAIIFLAEKLTHICVARIGHKKMQVLAVENTQGGPWIWMRRWMYATWLDWNHEYTCSTTIYVYKPNFVRCKYILYILLNNCNLHSTVLVFSYAQNMARGRSQESLCVYIVMNCLVQASQSWETARVAPFDIRRPKESSEHPCGDQYKPTQQVRKRTSKLKQWNLSYWELQTLPSTVLPSSRNTSSSVSSS